MDVAIVGVGAGIEADERFASNAGAGLSAVRCPWSVVGSVVRSSVVGWPSDAPGLVVRSTSLSQLTKNYGPNN